MSTELIGAPRMAPTSLPELQEAVLAAPRLLPRGRGTKPALSTPPDGATVLALDGLSGIQEYNPSEYTITALAGTPIADVAAALAGHGQYLPFDPPLARAGATLGGTVAAGLSGSGRYRYGGLRDFLIGVQLVDGQGRLVRGGGKVVKNAAGFDLPKLMIGSLGRLAVLGEVTFKVFPVPPAFATLRVHYPGIDAAAAALASLRHGSADLIALDVVPASPGHAGVALLARIGGPSAVLHARLDKLRSQLGSGDFLEGEAEHALWEGFAEFAWIPGGAALIKVPITPHHLQPLDPRLAAAGAHRTYAAGAALAWIAWPGALEELSGLLASAGLSGLVLRGHAPHPLIGAEQDHLLRSRIVAALDPHQRFLSY